jgi:hypothetical protein
VATFLLSVGAAMSSPPFQAVVPDLVSKPELGAAVALNSLGVNISRAIGPRWAVSAVARRAVDGVCPERAVRGRRGVGAVALASGTVHSASAAGALLLAVRSGIRYVHAAPVLRNVLVRTVAFFVFGSAGWALLPLVARRELGLGPAGYGVMLACIGLGRLPGPFCCRACASGSTPTA